MKKKILFVDDEQRVLDGLQRMLHARRGEWEMTFVDGGQAALDALDQAPFDVIVSDMRMPGIDGATLLGRVQAEHPSTVRIVLSGHAELEAALRAVPVAHQFLCKPCQAETLREVVTRACGLQALLDDATLQETLGGIDTIPALPRVYNELVAALADPEVALADVAAIVEQDLGITAKILQLVNSSFFGIKRRIADIRQATACLGTTMIRNLALSVEVFRAFEGTALPRGFSLEEEQAHANLTARIARNLVAGDKAQSESAFLAAVLHDLGRLILATKLPEVYQRAVAASHGERPSCETEEAQNGVSHAEIGAYLLGIWGMPYTVVEAVANHHHPARVRHESFDVLSAVHVADALAHEVSGATAPELDLDYLDSLGVVDQLPGWREMAAGEADARREEAA